MPDDKSAYWFLRVDDISGFDVQTLCGYKEWGAILAVREDPDNDSPNPHYHILLKYKDTRTKSTINKYLKELFPVLEGNKVFSNAVANPADFEKKVFPYMCKGKQYGYNGSNPNVVFNQSINPVDIRTAHTLYWETRKNMKKGGESGKEVTTKLIVAAKQLIQERTIKSPNWTDIANIVLEVAQGKLNDNVAFSCIQALMYHYNLEECKSTFTTRLYSKFYRN